MSAMEGFQNNNGNYKSFTTPRTFGTDPVGTANLIFNDWYYNGAFVQATIVDSNTVLDNSNMDINSTFQVGQQLEHLQMLIKVQIYLNSRVGLYGMLRQINNYDLINLNQFFSNPWVCVKHRPFYYLV